MCPRFPTQVAFDAL